MPDRTGKRITRSTTTFPGDLKEACTQIRRKNGQIESLQELNAKNRGKLAAVKAQLREKETLYSASANTNATQLTKLNELKAEVQTLTAAVQAGEAKIQELQTTNTAQAATVNDLTTQVQTMHVTVQAGEATMQQLAAANANLQEQITNNNNNSNVSSVAPGPKDELRDVADQIEIDAQFLATKIRRLAK